MGSKEKFSCRQNILELCKLYLAGDRYTHSFFLFHSFTSPTTPTQHTTMPKRKADTKEKASKEKTKKTKKTKDPNAPKRNKSAYLFFCDDKRDSVKKSNPDLKMTEVSKKLAELWRALGDSDKKVSGVF